MKNLVIVCILVCSFSNFRCTNNSDSIEIDKESFLTKEIGVENNIDFAEKKVGKLIKKEIKYIDESSGSEFVLVFGAMTENDFQKFFSENEVVLKGITEVQKKENLNSKRPKLPHNKLPSQNSNENLDFNENEVFYDLISKKLKRADIGYSFTIKPKSRKYDFLTSKNLRPGGISWRQQTSLPWCEAATIYMNTEGSPSNYYLYRQTRGIFWSGSGSPDGVVTSDGSIYDTGVDGPKYTRFGGYGPVAYVINYITWYDFETNGEVNGSILN